MTRRPHRVPGMSSPTWRREVACGVDPVRAVSRALLAGPFKAGDVWSVGVGHDDDCPALERGLPACTCELVTLEGRRACRQDAYRKRKQGLA